LYIILSSSGRSWWLDFNASKILLKRGILKKTEMIKDNAVVKMLQTEAAMQNHRTV
jgi:hypothetical protein